jgi:hypothetical protein
MKSTVHDLPLSHLRLKQSVRLLALAGLVSLSGCLGGGDDAAAPPAAAAAAAVVSGSVGSAAPAAGSASKAAVLAGATIEVGLYTKTDVQVDKQTQISNAAGGYELTVNDPDGMLADGGYLVVTVKRDGFSDFSNRIDFDTLPERLQIPEAQLSSVVTTVSSVGNTLSASASNGSFVMGIVRMRDGSQQALAGKQYLAAKAAGADPDLEIDIPSASLPGVETIKGQLKSFDSSDANDARNFPGAYRDTNGNTIVSLGFDYMNLTDGDTGQNLGQVAQAARAARGLRKAAVNWTAPTIVTRYLPTGSANNLLQDACDDPDKADISISDATSNCSALRLADQANPVQTLGNEAEDGFQVPIYTYIPAQGVWELFGIGSLVKDYNGNSNSLLKYSDVTDLNSDGQIDSADFRAYAATHQLNVRIYVTNETFQRQYWNLDYPLLFAQPVTLCVQGKVTRSDTGAGISGMSLSFSDNDNPQTFSYGSGSTDSEGNYKISVMLQSEASDSATDRAGTLSYYDSYDSSYQQTNANVATTPCATQDVVITPPALASVRGRVLDRAGSPKAGEWVWGQGGGRYFSTTTGSDGVFRAEVRQATTYTVSFGNSGFANGSFNANGTVAGLENSDSTTEVVLNDLSMVNRAPYAYGYPLSSGMRLKGSATTASTSLYLWGYDYDGTDDFPVSWQVLNGGVCNEDGSFSGGTTTGLSGQFTQDVYSATVDIALAQGSHNLMLGLTDRAGKQGCSNLGTLTVWPPAANRAPAISWLASEQGAYDKNATMTFTGYAYEPDGDGITGSWSISSGTLLCTSPAPVIAGEATTCTATAPNLDTPVTVTWTVTDNVNPPLSSSRSIQVQVGTPPSNLNVIVR